LAEVAIQACRGLEAVREFSLNWRPSGDVGLRGRLGNDLASPMMDAQRNAWVWMAAAFCASFGLATGIVAFFGMVGGVYIALAATARLAFLLFWPAYVAGALTSLFGNVFSPLREHARDFGLAFAAAVLVHLGLVVCLCVIGHAPSVGTFLIFGVAAGFTYLLALLSVQRVRQALPQKLWLPIRAVAMNYIALTFLIHFHRPHLTDLSSAVQYSPFAALAIVGPMLRLAAWAKSHRHTPDSHAHG
jgi:hypothetical protein